MNSYYLRLVALISCVALLAACWVAIIWVALSVSSIVLNSLDMIIKLAGITP